MTVEISAVHNVVVNHCKNNYLKIMYLDGAPQRRAHAIFYEIYKYLSILALLGRFKREIRVPFSIPVFSCSICSRSQNSDDVRHQQLLSFFDSYPVMYRRAYLWVYFLNPSPTYTNSTNNTKLHKRYRYSSSTVKLVHLVLAKYDWIIIVFRLIRGYYYYLRVGVEIRPRVEV